MKLPRFNEEAVSPVIGVILMVAIVVILAAVVWVAVAPMADENLQSTKIVKITGKMPNSSAIEYIVVGGSGLNQVNAINYSINGTDQKTLFTAPTVGEITSITAAKGDRVVLIGLFDDGSEQIIDDRTY